MSKQDDQADILQASTGGPDFTVKEWPSDRLERLAAEQSFDRSREIALTDRPVADLPLLSAAKRMAEYHVPNVHTDKFGRRTVDDIETVDGRTIVVCAGCGQEYPCEVRELIDLIRGRSDD